MLRKHAKKSMFLNVEGVYLKEARKKIDVPQHRARLCKESKQKNRSSFT